MKNVTERTTSITNGRYDLRKIICNYTEYGINTKHSDGTEINVIVHMGLTVWCETNDSEKVRFLEDDYMNWLTPIGLSIRDFINTIITAKQGRK